MYNVLLLNHQKMSEKPKPYPNNSSNDKVQNKLCYGYSVDERDQVSDTRKLSEGKICFDTDEKVTSLSEILDSEDEKQCLDYEIEARDIILSNLEIKKGTMCFEKEK